MQEIVTSVQFVPGMRFLVFDFGVYALLSYAIAMPCPVCLALVYALPCVVLDCCVSGTWYRSAVAGTKRWYCSRYRFTVVQIYCG
eukprot:3442149-Rhodomonas_salina.2